MKITLIFNLIVDQCGYMIDDLNHDYSILEIINKESDELLLETINE